MSEELDKKLRKLLINWTNDSKQTNEILDEYIKEIKELFE